MSARDQVAAYIRKNIFTGYFAPGTLIRQEKLSQDLGVSRTPIREAIQQLVSEGILTQEPHRGAVVRNLTDKEISERHYIYATLLGGIVRLAFQNGIDKKDLAHLRQVMKDSFDHRKFQKLSECDTILHELLLEACNNDELKKLCMKYAAKGLSIRTKGDEINADYVRWLYEQELALIDAMEEKDAPTASNILMNIEMRSAEVQIENRKKTMSES